MQAFGAEPIEHGHDFQAAREHATALGAERGLQIVPSYHPDLVLGVATYARELFAALPDLDAVHVPVGMGSGIRRAVRPTRSCSGRFRPARPQPPSTVTPAFLEWSPW